MIYYILYIILHIILISLNTIVLYLWMSILIQSYSGSSWIIVEPQR